MRFLAWSLAVLVSLPQAATQPNYDAAVKRVASDTTIAAAMAAIDRDHERLVTDIIAITEIPAPPFKEAKRGDAMLERFKALGLSDVERDTEGNVMGVRRGTRGSGKLVAICAHLDTVFPEGTDVRVKRQGTRLSAPGIGDNTRSLAVMVAMIRAMNEAKVQTAGDILFVADVGEEGAGDLRGVKFLLTKGRYKDRIGQFIALDGSESAADIVYGGVGSRRYRVTFNGPGGHSYTAFGLASPAFAMADAMKRLGAVPVPTTPKTTFNVGVIGGGTSINSIPNSMWMEVDMRSESPLELEKIEAAFLAIVKESVAAENKARSTAQGVISADLKLIGARPSGQTKPDAPLVQIALASARAAGLTPQLGFSSTDANFPISLGIPSIRLMSGAMGGNPHSLEEWIDVEKTASVRAIRSVLVTLVAAANLGG